MYSYQLYLEYCKDNKIPEESIGKQWLYTEIFNYEFNFAFKNPDNDTCDDCDQFKLKLQEATEDNRLSIQHAYDNHLTDASNRYKMKNADKEHAEENYKQIVLMIDLQKCLPTPELHNSQSFYNLKLWTYNLVIHNSTEGRAYCMMWVESMSGRGGNEVASCLSKWSQVCNISEEIEELTIWSDNCPSQNRNAQILMSYFVPLEKNPNIKCISHKSLTKGHTHLEADSDHSIIERERKKIPQLKIITPWDWQQLVRLCRVKKSFDVTGMETRDL
nr:unnamed protein product [Callosobruchus chinensis]